MYKFDSFFSDTSINIDVESDKGVYLNFTFLVIIHKYLFILNNAEKEYVVTITNTPDKTFKLGGSRGVIRTFTYQKHNKNV